MPALPVLDEAASQVSKQLTQVAIAENNATLIARQRQAKDSERSQLQQTRKTMFDERAATIAAHITALESDKIKLEAAKTQQHQIMEQLCQRLIDEINRQHLHPSVVFDDTIRTRFCDPIKKEALLMASFPKLAEIETALINLETHRSQRAAMNPQAVQTMWGSFNVQFEKIKTASISYCRLAKECQENTTAIQANHQLIKTITDDINQKLQAQEQSLSQACEQFKQAHEKAVKLLQTQQNELKEKLSSFLQSFQHFCGQLIDSVNVLLTLQSDKEQVPPDFDARFATFRSAVIRLQGFMEAYEMDLLSDGSESFRALLDGVISQLNICFAGLNNARQDEKQYQSSYVFAATSFILMMLSNFLNISYCSYYMALFGAAGSLTGIAEGLLALNRRGKNNRTVKTVGHPVNSFLSFFTNERDQMPVTIKFQGATMSLVMPKLRVASQNRVVPEEQSARRRR